MVSKTQSCTLRCIRVIEKILARLTNKKQRKKNSFLDTKKILADMEEIKNYKNYKNKWYLVTFR